MKLIFLVQFKTKRGGMMQSLWSLINGLSSDPFFDIYIVMPNGADFCDIPFKGDVTVFTTSFSQWSIAKEKLLGAFKVAYEIYGKIKHLLPHAYCITNDIGGSILLSLMPTFRVKEIYVNRGGNFHGLGLGGWFIRNKIRLKRLNAVVATSSRQAKLIENYGFPIDKIRIIHNGISLPTQTYNVEAINNERLRISSIGFLSDGKNHILGIYLIGRLRDKRINAELNIWGEACCDSDLIYKKKLEQIIQEQHLENFVHFRGFVEKEKIYEETDIVISFSKSEGFGRTLVEGMLRNKPIVAWRGAGGPVDITQNGKYGYLVDCNVVEDYASVIEWMIEHPMLVKQNVILSRKFCMENFVEDVMWKKYAEFFKSIACGI